MPSGASERGAETLMRRGGSGCGDQGSGALAAPGCGFPRKRSCPCSLGSPRPRRPPRAPPRLRRPKPRGRVRLHATDDHSDTLRLVASLRAVVGDERDRRSADAAVIARPRRDEVAQASARRGSLASSIERGAPEEVSRFVTSIDRALRRSSESRVASATPRSAKARCARAPRSRPRGGCTTAQCAA